MAGTRKGITSCQVFTGQLISPMKEVWMGKCYIDLMQLLIIIYICLNNRFAKFVMFLKVDLCGHSHNGKGHSSSP